MTQVNESKSEMMSAKKMGILAVIADDQSAKLVDPRKTAFTGEALFIDGGVEEAFPSAFDGFAVAFVLTDVGDDTVIETHLACIQRIKGAIGVEVGSANRQSQVLHVSEGGLQMRFEVESIVMVARHDPGRSHHVPLSVRDR